MRGRTRAAVVAVASGAFVFVGGAGAVTAIGGSPADDGGAATADDGPQDDDLERAREAALAQTGGGRVTGTEIGDEESHYEIEVTLDGGRQVDVQLDESFAVVRTMTDREPSPAD